ncbi:MAG: serine/threonine protein kinase [Deltaproteobacteria bacterium]|nr:MAG: serine/threonine protein kinase [Deltaproteobacteria bacterium]
MSDSNESKREARERLPAGTVVGGRFEIRSYIARGGMGHVYRAVQRPLDRTVALKIMRRELVDDQTGKRRFAQEALAVSRLHHPNTVRVYDVGELSAGRFFIAMEFVEGIPLHEEIHRLGRISPRRALAILRQIADSLDEAHRRQIVHRDLKPDNILLSRVGDNDDFVKVLDFGIARVLDEDTTTRITVAGYVCGTPEYMAPEQARGEEIDGRADLYALGVLLYEMLGGSLPFEGSTPLAVLLAHQNDPVPALPPEIPRHVSDLCVRLLSKNADDRPHDAASLLTLIDLAIAEFEHLDDPDTGDPHSETVTIPAVRPRIERDAPTLHRSLQDDDDDSERPSSIIVADDLAEPPGAIDGIPSATISIQDLPSTPRPTARPALDRKRLIPLVALAALAALTTTLALRSCEDAGPTDEPRFDRASLPAPPADPLPPDTARVPVLSAPPGATVLLDGERVGVTPLFVERPASRAVLLEVTLDGHVARTVVLPELAPGQTPETLEIALNRQLHVVRFVSDPPGAEVRLADRSTPFCTTPCEHAFATDSGPWTVEISLSGHESRSVLVEQTAEQPTPVTVTLSPRLDEDDDEAHAAPAPPRRRPGSRSGAARRDPFAGSSDPAPTGDEDEESTDFPVLDQR